MSVATPNRATASVLLLALLGGGIAGVAAGAWAAWWGGVLAWFGVVALVAYMLMLRAARPERMLVVCVAVLGVALGLARVGASGPDADSVARLVGSERTVEGTIVLRDTSEDGQRLTLGALVVDGVPASDRVLASVPLEPRLAPGDRIALSCALRQPEAFDSFAYDRYLAARNVYATCRTFGEPFVVALAFDTSWRTAMLRSREAMIARIESAFGEPHAALLSGLLFGTSRFSDAWNERFAMTGTSHLVAASGYNVAVVSSLLLTTLISLGLWRRHAFALILVGLAAYAVLAGAEPPVVRAAVMGALVVVARQTGRRTTMRNIFLLAVAVMLAHEPRLLRDDVGFQLSVAATAGLLVWARPLERKLTFITPFLGVRAALAATLAATASTLPILVTSFGRLSLVAPIANLLVLPMVPFAMGLGAFGAAFGSAAAWPAWLLLTTMLEVIALLARVPFAAFAVGDWGGRALFVLAVVVAVLLGRVIARGSRLMAPTRGWRIVAGGALALFLVAILHRNAVSASAPLTVWFFDVGQGDAIFVDGPERDILVDGGRSSVIVEKLTSVLPPWDRTLDMMLLTHIDGDHRNGLADVARRFTVGEVLTSGQGDATAFGAIIAAEAPTRLVVAGDVIDLGGGATLRALWPMRTGDVDDTNAGSIVLLLSYGETTVLLTGDAGVDEEASFLVNLSHVDVLKAGHHGSRTSTSTALLDVITPDVAILSVGKDNTYGHPHADVVARLERFGVLMLRTDRDGDIRLTSTGSEPTIEPLELW